MKKPYSFSKSNKSFNGMSRALATAERVLIDGFITPRSIRLICINGKLASNASCDWERFCIFLKLEIVLPTFFSNSSSLTCFTGARWKIRKSSIIHNCIIGADVLKLKKK